MDYALDLAVVANDSWVSVQNRLDWLGKYSNYSLKHDDDVSGEVVLLVVVAVDAADDGEDDDVEIWPYCEQFVAVVAVGVKQPLH